MSSPTMTRDDRLYGDMVQHLDLFLGTENIGAAMAVSWWGRKLLEQKCDLFPILYMVLKSLPSTPGKD